MTTIHVDPETLIRPSISIEEQEQEDGSFVVNEDSDHYWHPVEFVSDAPPNDIIGGHAQLILKAGEEEWKLLQAKVMKHKSENRYLAAYTIAVKIQ